MESRIVINCAGAWAAQVAKTAGVNLPIDPVKRQVFVVDTAVKPDGPLPLTILPGGLYFRTETGGLIHFDYVTDRHLQSSYSRQHGIPLNYFSAFLRFRSLTIISSSLLIWPAIAVFSSARLAK